MANYIVGDPQGCYQELQLLLKQAQFNPQHDTLWLAGDLVARGDDSLSTLRFIKSLGDSAKVVLGNHDLHLLAVANGVHRAKERDKTQPILDASDRNELLNWLRQQPLLAEHDEFVMCHAGVSPQWDLDTARRCADEVHQQLTGENWQQLLVEMYDNQPDLWDESLAGYARLRFIINAYTRMRFCFVNGALDMDCKLPPSQVNDGELTPWFKLKGRKPIEKTILFGHWAALEGYEDSNVIGLDTGCVWGGTLTMLRWEDKRYFKQAAL